MLLEKIKLNEYNLSKDYDKLYNNVKDDISNSNIFNCLIELTITNLETVQTGTWYITDKIPTNYIDTITFNKKIYYVADEESLRENVDNYTFDKGKADTLQKKINTNIDKEKNKNYVASTRLVETSTVIRDNTSVGTRELLIKNFLEEQVESGIFKKDVYNLQTTITKVINRLGFTDNIFFKFLEKYYALNDTISSQGFKVIENLYSNGTLVDSDLLGNTSDGLNSIIFNETLYKYPEKELAFIINAYEWLSDEYNLQTKTNNNTLLRDKYKITTPFQKFTQKTAKRLRDLIIFNNGEVNNKQQISTSLDELQTQYKSRVNRENTFKLNPRVRNSRKWEDVWDSVDKLKTLSPDEIKEFATWLKNKYDISLGNNNGN